MKKLIFLAAAAFVLIFSSCDKTCIVLRVDEIWETPIGSEYRIEVRRGDVAIGQTSQPLVVGESECVPVTISKETSSFMADLVIVPEGDPRIFVVPGSISIDAVEKKCDSDTCPVIPIRISTPPG